ncbi:MAG TPA: CPBP family intramembrane glutamic endopeptidase [Ktedonobacterales bacterium]|nr:CPBP family intramembrane glutamic endopeptidase [Ktedonobacterales bacterium]
MSSEYPEHADQPTATPLTLPPPPEPAAATQPRPAHIYHYQRSTVADTWGWLWKDSLQRLLPFAAASAVYARVSGEGARTLGLTREGWRRDALLGIGLGMPLAGVAAAFRGWVAPSYRLPTPADQAVQTTYYLGLNGPIEELFWRGVVQALAVRALGRLPVPGRSAALAGWALTTAIFGAYHRLGNWSWRSIAGVTAAGGLFGALYLASGRRRSLLPAIIVHGFMTAGFLSWGDAALHARAARRIARSLRGAH